MNVTESIDQVFSSISDVDKYAEQTLENYGITMSWYADLSEDHKKQIDIALGDYAYSLASWMELFILMQEIDKIVYND